MAGSSVIPGHATCTFWLLLSATSKRRSTRADGTRQVVQTRSFTISLLGACTWAIEISLREATAKRR